MHDLIDDEPEIIAVMQGNPFTPKDRIIAALVVRLGGKVKLTGSELLLVEGMTIVDTDHGGVKFTASSHLNKKRFG
jgi:hypothetical protein